VVDANLRSPELHNVMQVETCPACGRKPNERGLLQAAEDHRPIREFTRRLDPGHLSILTSGGSVADAYALLGSENAQKRFAELAREFDYVIVDELMPWEPVHTHGGIVEHRGAFCRRKILREFLELIPQHRV
jgi:Mrp family chromosome partitioning ATPase